MPLKKRINAPTLSLYAPFGNLRGARCCVWLSRVEVEPMQPLAGGSMEAVYRAASEGDVGVWSGRSRTGCSGWASSRGTVEAAAAIVSVSL